MMDFLVEKCSSSDSHENILGVFFFLFLLSMIKKKDDQSGKLNLYVFTKLIERHNYICIGTLQFNVSLRDLWKITGKQKVGLCEFTV